MSTTAYDDQYAPEPTTPAPSPAEVYANLQAQVVQWARDRNLIEGSTLQAQACKLWEEFGELATGVNKGRLELALDGIGDCLVVLTIMHEQLAAHTALRVNPVRDKPTAQHLAPRTPDELPSARHLLLRAAHSLASLPVCSPTFECWEIVFASYDLQRIAYKLGTTPEACLQTAWDEIKDRKGRMIDGVFVKEADLCKQPAS